VVDELELQFRSISFMGMLKDIMCKNQREKVDLSTWHISTLIVNAS